MACEILTSPLVESSRPSGGLESGGRFAAILDQAVRPMGSLVSATRDSGSLTIADRPDTADFCRSYDFEQPVPASSMGGFGTYAFGSPFFGNLAAS